MGAKRIRLQGECDDRKRFSVPPGFESLTSFTLQKVENNEEACNSVAVGNESEQGPVQVASTATIISTGKLKSSVRRRPWILDDHVDHMEENFECESDKGSSSHAYLPRGVIRGCSSCHNCQKVIARSRPESARIPSLDEAPVLHPTEEEFKDTLKYVASILPHVKQYGVCRIVPPSSWRPPCRIEEEDTRCGVNTRIQRISDLQSLFLKMRLEGAHKKTNNRRQKIPSMKPEFGHSVERKEFGCCDEHFEFESGPKFKLKSFKNYADHFKRQYFVKEDQITASNFNSDAMQMLSEPSIPDIEGEYWRIIENPTEEIEVLHGNTTETSASQSGFPLKTNPRDVTACPEYVESGWNLNNTPKLQDSLLRFESCNSSSILLPRLSFGMCFSSNQWATQFSPSILTSEGIPVYRCVQNPKEFVLILPGAYHAEFDSGFNCYEAVNFSPFDWLPHGQNAVELYREQDRKTSISHDKLLLEAAAEAIRTLGELALRNNNSFDDSKWRTVCRNYGYLTKALKTRVATEARRRKYLFASLESRKMEDDFCATTKQECVACFCDLYLSAIGCKCSAHKYTCLLHAKQLCDCAWSERYLLIRYEIDELNIMVEDLDRKVSAVHNRAKEKLGLPVSDVSKDAINEVGMETMKHKPVIPNVELSESTSHRSTSRQASDIQQYRNVDVFFAPSVVPSSTTMNLNHRSQLKENVHDENKVLLPKVSQNTAVGENIATSSSTVLKKHLAQGSSSTVRDVIILSDDED
ncbi:putative lysine-specific demethylase JMJ16 isoform X2 [Solanum lycopersicum]|uniref:putative lysine-specific demethylase JMJ16 isoform X2 n=1 Tax=Solanum lycopersicum TaxID=4081 RepID=UPI000532C14C|nr:putative lysine-specific demethylase JMJ16 isoform X2 [Solanum lycopersicum]